MGEIQPLKDSSLLFSGINKRGILLGEIFYGGIMEALLGYRLYPSILLASIFPHISPVISLQSKYMSEITPHFSIFPSICAQKKKNGTNKKGNEMGDEWRNETKDIAARLISERNEGMNERTKGVGR